MNQIVLIGTSHEYQHCGKPGADVFERFIMSHLDSPTFTAIAEEMSCEALSEQGTAQSVGSQVACQRDIRHLYCDPNSQTRNRLGVRQEAEIRIAASFANHSEERVRQLIQESYDLREQYWLDQILTLDCWPVLFICGANHVDSFRTKIEARGLSASILTRDWSP